MGNVAIVTGSRTGIGYAVSEMLRDAGWTVYGLSPDEFHGAFVTVHDVASLKVGIDEQNSVGGRAFFYIACSQGRFSPFQRRTDVHGSSGRDQNGAESGSPSGRKTAEQR